ncbi:DUF3769 domain-containing protein [Microcoleus sp. FACHB-SPT15]|uniref:DUF3769 domain-containing protein n=1 Tax=Microcoleus sp. FACHB-SPT15 TaxID=2692830 RepID=UPI001785E8A7|nr:DUF3769 domain-containing protein [Microcoleus sp. FACHB-SPT15]MBD1809424.1 DUF3769 domain-containing protein [Microcoleus sp. FACHB-SPT15]
MPQPVQPPEIPAIIEFVTFEDEVQLNKFSLEPSATLPSRTLPAGVLATPTPPETFAPESSSLRVERSASLLGSRISANHSSLPVAVEPSGQAQVRESSVPASQLTNQLLTASPSLEHGEAEENSSILTSEAPNVVTTDSNASNLASERPSTTTSLTPSDTTSNTYEVAPKVKRLITQERGGLVREFEFTVPTETETQPSPNEDVTPAPDEGEDEVEDEAPPPLPASPDATTTPTTPFGTGGVIELTADQQEYDEQRQVITATGNVILRFREALLDADRVEVNLPNRIIVAEGNVALTRGEQVLRGERFEYYFVQDSGVILNASGELYTPTSGTDFDIFAPTDGSTGTVVNRPVSDRITSNQPLGGITNLQGYSFSVGAGSEISNVAAPQTGGTLTQFRYIADRVDFEGSEAIATNVRITNDPFSPPELELRADTARFRRVEPLVDEIVASRPRLVFDQGLELPTFRNRVVIDRREREPALFNFGFDSEDRGGLFVERTFEIVNTPAVRFNVTPQYFLQKAVFEEGVIDPSVFGVRARVNATLSPRTTVVGTGILTSFDLGELEDELRASVRLQQGIDIINLPHTLSLEYSYRNRLFNGTLGEQTVQSSLGAVLSSPNIPVGNTGVNLSYQVGAQYINADTDRLDLLEPIRENNRVSLGRYQGVVSLSKGFLLWQGEGLPATPTEGLRYTPAPVVPYLSLGTDLTGVVSAYSNGETQESLSGTIGLVGQIGHFSKPFLDYTGFNISYSQVVRSGLSPFLFDRDADTSVLSGGINQQIYGPFRAGFQTSISLDNNEQISTDYFLEYSRRTYNVLLRFNPVLGLGSLSLRINDFNWTGNPGSFSGADVRPVVQGVTR